MLSSIHPLGERSRNSRWWLTTTSHIAGAGAGGATVGLAAGTIGWLLVGSVPPIIRLGLLGAVALFAVLVEIEKLSVPLPSWHRQVNEAWLDEYRGWVYGAGFGYQLGLGVATIITTATVHVLLAAALLSASPLSGLLLGSIFGLVRGGLLLTGHSITSPMALRAFHQRLANGARAADVIARSALTLTAGTALIGVVAGVVIGDFTL